MIKRRTCSICVMDESDPGIVFDGLGRCTHCRGAGEIVAGSVGALSEDKKRKKCGELITTIQSAGRGRQYDCIIGVSGGVDSTYTAYVAVQAGLRPLAVHLDNGWNSRLAVANIERTLKKLGVDLFTHVIDWDEFRDLQLAFLRASVPDLEIPTDHAIGALLYAQARRHGIKYIVAGTNVSTESILPSAWAHGHRDWKYIREIKRRFGGGSLKTFPHYTFWRDLWDRGVRKTQWVSLLDYVDYHKESAKVILTKELGWEDYGAKHFESIFTRFMQAYILPVKFGFDKRRAHLSSLIVSGQITREEALQELQKPLYEPSVFQEDYAFFLNKLGLTEVEFQAIMKRPNRSFGDYPSYEKSLFYRWILALVRRLKSRGIAP